MTSRKDTIQAPDGPLSVAQLQQAMRIALAGRGASGLAVLPAGVPDTAPERPERPERPGRRDGGTASLPSPASGQRREIEEGTVAVGEGTGRSWVAVAGAGPQVGCSTVALMVAEAVAGSGRAVHLVEAACSCRSGLAGVTSVELGSGPDREWRRGTRGLITVDRRIGDRSGEPTGVLTWPKPVPPASAASAGFATLVDLGARPGLGALVPGAGWERVPRAVLLVARGTLPGLDVAEQVLAGWGAAPVTGLVVVGPRRWSRQVRTGLGPGVRRLEGQSRVVIVPVDRRMEVTGLTVGPLPRSLIAAGGVLLRLLAGIE